VSKKVEKLGSSVRHSTQRRAAKGAFRFVRPVVGWGPRDQFLVRSTHQRGPVRLSLITWFTTRRPQAAPVAVSPVDLVEWNGRPLYLLVLACNVVILYLESSVVLISSASLLTLPGTVALVWRHDVMASLRLGNANPSRALYPEFGVETTGLGSLPSGQGPAVVKLGLTNVMRRYSYSLQH